MKCHKLIGVVWILLSSFSKAYAGYGIDCAKPSSVPFTVPNATTAFHFTCTNNTPATFSYFNLKITELDSLPPATTTVSVQWPHGEEDIRPGDQGQVTGTISPSGSGIYYFDFTKGYGGETYTGIFCKNTTSSNCMTVQSVILPPESMAYVANSANGTVSRCALTANGNINDASCTTASSGFADPFYMAINPTRTFIYITDLSAFTVTKCSFAANGNFVIPCTTFTSVATGIVAPTGIALHPRKYLAYVNNFVSAVPGVGTVSKCRLNTNGNFTTCTQTPALPTPSPFTLPTDLAITKDGQRVYVVNIGTPAVRTCNIDTNGEFFNCTSAGGGVNLSGSFGIALNKDETFAYVTNVTGDYVAKCPIVVGGLFDTCTQTAGGFVTDPSDITINAADKLAYITNSSTDTVTKCSFAANGDLTNCTISGVDFDEPVGIALR